MQKSSSWEGSAEWYDKIVGEKGHYFHEHLILPYILKLKPKKVLDIACGQGILARHLPPTSEYLGIDISPTLIASAKKYKTPCKANFLVKDATKELDLKGQFTHATVILALQNIEEPLKVFENAHKYLEPGGKLLLILNHPCFRIPRQSSWQTDPQKKMQYRRLDRYMSSLKIPIQTHPGTTSSDTTYSFHHPLSAYTHWLHTTGFTINLIDELCSDKKSTGPMAKAEDTARREFPLFLTILAEKRPGTGSHAGSGS